MQGEHFLPHVMMNRSIPENTVATKRSLMRKAYTGGNVTDLERENGRNKLRELEILSTLGSILRQYESERRLPYILDVRESLHKPEALVDHLEILFDLKFSHKDMECLLPRFGDSLGRIDIIQVLLYAKSFELDNSRKKIVDRIIKKRKEELASIISSAERKSIIKSDESIRRIESKLAQAALNIIKADRVPGFFQSPKEYFTAVEFKRALDKIGVKLPQKDIQLLWAKYSDKECPVGLMNFVYFASDLFTLGKYASYKEKCQNALDSFKTTLAAKNSESRASYNADFSVGAADSVSDITLDRVLSSVNSLPLKAAVAAAARIPDTGSS